MPEEEPSWRWSLHVGPSPSVSAERVRSPEADLLGSWKPRKCRPRWQAWETLPGWLTKASLGLWASRTLKLWGEGAEIGLRPGRPSPRSGYSLTAPHQTSPQVPTCSVPWGQSSLQELRECPTLGEGIASFDEPSGLGAVLDQHGRAPALPHLEAHSPRHRSSDNRKCPCPSWGGDVSKPPFLLSSTSGSRTGHHR